MSGQSARANGLEKYFNKNIEMACLVDIKPLELRLTWSNNRAGSDGVFARLDRFLIHGSQIVQVGRMRSWVEAQRYSDNFPIMLEIENNDSELGAPFKYNMGWFVEEYFQGLVKEIWNQLDSNLCSSSCEQFGQSLKMVKEKVISWAKKSFKNRDRLL